MFRHTLHFTYGYHEYEVGVEGRNIIYIVRIDEQKEELIDLHFDELPNTIKEQLLTKIQNG